MTFDLTILNKPLAPGLTYSISSGEYHNNRVHIKASGTEKQPITIQTSGNVIITDKTTIRISGSHIIFQGFTFRNLSSKNPIKIQGTNIRFTKNTIEEMATDIEQCIQVSGQHNRIDNNTFRTIRCMGVLISIIGKDNLIDNNNFSDRFPQNDEKNGQEIITVGDKKIINKELNCVIYGNKFSNCSGDNEMILINSRKNIISNNTITECIGQIVLKGSNNYVLRNYINGCKKLGASGIELLNAGHIVQFNTFEHLVDEVKCPIGIICGTSYITITNNDFINCFNCFSIGIKKGKNVLPINLNINTNRIIKCNYMFNKSKDNKGYGENVSITNNPLFKYDQKLNLFPPQNPEKIDFKKFYDMLLRIVPQPTQEKDPDLYLDQKVVNLTKRLKRSNNILDKLRELKVLRSKSTELFGKIQSKQKEVDDLLK